MTFVQDVVVPGIVSSLEFAQGTPSAKLTRLAKDLAALWATPAQPTNK
jgi:hypothetical protein